MTVLYHLLMVNLALIVRQSKQYQNTDTYDHSHLHHFHSSPLAPGLGKTINRHYQDLLYQPLFITSSTFPSVSS